eukprot:4522285-Pyramimonas_sp.AAC.1
MRIIDTVIKRSLCSLPWFPTWLGGLKACLQFLRYYSDDVVKAIRQTHPSVAQLVAKISIPYFAEWRWGTLHKACKAMSVLLDICRRLWSSFDFVAKIRDAALLKKVRASLLSHRWAVHFKFVEWHADWLSSLQSWGGSCACHQQEYRNGRT